MGIRFHSDKGLQSYYNTKHDWHQSHVHEECSKIETQARETGYPRYALPAAEVVSIAGSSSSVSNLETELSFEHLEENYDEDALEDALEEQRDQGRNNP
jgi:hypothetical protein